MSERSRIDGVLSTHFDECSIAAADAARIARFKYEEHQDDVISRRVQPIGRFEVPQLESFEYVPITQIKTENELVVGGGVHLGLAKHPDIEDLPISLVAIFNNDLMMPIATFEERTQGECSYVQIGQEIDDDKIVVISDSPRSNYVEAVRTLLRTWGDEAPDLITHLVDSELSEYRSQIQDQLSPAVCRIAEEYFLTNDEDNRAKVLDLNVLNGDVVLDSETTEKRRVLARGLTITGTGEELSSIGGRATRIVLARDVVDTQTVISRGKGPFKKQQTVVHKDTPTGDLQLFAIVRGEVAFKMAHFSETGLVYKENTDGSLDSEALSCLLRFLNPDAELERVAVKRVKGMYLTAKNNKHNTKLNINDNGKLDFGGHRREGYYDYISDHRQYDVIDYADWHHFKEALTTSKGFKHMKAKHRALLNGDSEDVLAKLYETFNLTGSFNCYLGGGETATEMLIVRLGNLAINGQLHFAGILREKTAGKTVTDVDTTVDLSMNDGGDIHVHVAGRPVALKGFNPETFFNIALTQRGINDIDEDTVTELAEVVSTICTDKR